MKNVPVQAEYGNLQYFGYVDKNGHPLGTGLMYFDKEEGGKFRQYFVEKISSFKANKNDFTNNFNGMGMESINDLQSFGFYKDSEYHGPRIFCKANEPTCYVNFNEGVRDGFGIELEPDNTYYVSCFKKGKLLDRCIYFNSDGAIYFKKNIQGKMECVGLRKSMWDYKVPYGLTYYMMPFSFSKAVQPLVSRKIYRGKSHFADVIYEYGIQCAGWDRTSKYDYDYQNNKIMGGEHSYGNAIYKSKNLTYFGSAESSCPNTDDPLEKELGCLRTNNYTFLGSFYKNRRRFGLNIFGNCVQFGNIAENNTRFEIYKDYLLIKHRTIKGNYIKIYKDTLFFEQYENDKVIFSADLDKLNERVDDVPIGIERIDPIKLMMLRDYDLDVTDDGKIYIKKARFGDSKAQKTNPNIYFPMGVYGIRSGAFSNVKKVCQITVAGRDLTDIEKGAFVGCDVKNMVFGNLPTDYVLYEDTSTSESLTTLRLTGNVKCVKSGAFSKCIKLKRAVVTSECVVEEGAFPPNCLVVRYGVDKNKVKEVDAITQAPKKKYYYLKNKKIKSRSGGKSHSSRGFIGKSLQGIGDFFGTIWYGIKQFFRFLFKTIMFLPILIYKLFAKLFRNIFDSGVRIRFSWRTVLDILPYVIMIAYIVLASTCTIQLFGVSSSSVSWLSNWLEGYGLTISSFAAGLFEGANFLLYIFILAFVIIGFLLDIVVNILLFLALVLAYILMILLYFAITYIIPVLVPVYFIVMLCRRDNKIYDGILLFISIVACVLYFVIYFKVGFAMLM